MFAYNMTPASINIMIDGRMRAVSNTHPNFVRIKGWLRTHNDNGSGSYPPESALEGLRKLVDIPSFVALVTEGRVQINAEKVLFDGVAVNGVITERLLAMLKEGYDVKPLARFLDKVMLNPLQSARDELYLFLEASSLPITFDGDFLAFKKVRSDYKSFYDTTFDNSIGSTPSIPRETCDTDRHNTCSTGLHFCSFPYLGSYVGSQGRVVICKINPADVTAIPSDYNNTKGRAWTYQIIGEVPEDKCKHVWHDTPVVSSFGTYDDEQSDIEDDEYDGSEWDNYAESSTDETLTDVSASDACYGDNGELDDTEEEGVYYAAKLITEDERSPDSAFIDYNFEDEDEVAALLRQCAPIVLKTTSPEVLDTVLKMPYQSPSLGWAFYWKGTPQGNDYWQQISSEGACFEVQDYGFLLGLLTEVLADRLKGTNFLHLNPSIMGLQCALDPAYKVERANFLAGAFSWDNTPQGVEYWDAVFDDLDNEKNMPPDAESYVRALEIMTRREIDLFAYMPKIVSLDAFTPPAPQPVTTTEQTFVHAKRVFMASELKALVAEHGQRGTARLTGIPRTTLQEWLKDIADNDDGCDLKAVAE